MTLSEKEMRRVRGAGIGIAFQEPGAALNPVLKIGTQVGESLRIHKGLSRKAAWREAVRSARSGLTSRSRASGRRRTPTSCRAA